MAIEKKSLLKSMKTTEKNIVAGGPEAGSAMPARIKAAAKKAAPRLALAVRLRGH